MPTGIAEFNRKVQIGRQQGEKLGQALVVDVPVWWQLQQDRRETVVRWNPRQVQIGSRITVISSRLATGAIASGTAQKRQQQRRAEQGNQADPEPYSGSANRVNFQWAKSELVFAANQQSMISVLSVAFFPVV